MPSSCGGLRLDLLLSAQQPLSRLAADRMNGALEDLARVTHIQRQLFEQWAVLETLTPSEYVGTSRSADRTRRSWHPS